MPMAMDLKPYIRECRSCEAPIIWARTLSGRTMPIDAEPSYAGNVLLENRQGFLRATVLTAEEAADMYDPDPTSSQHLRTSHFATCPQALNVRGIHDDRH